MMRSILAVIAGLAASFVAISALQYLNSLVFPPPEGLDPKDPDDLKLIAAQLPVAALLGLEVTYLLGSLAGGAVVGMIARGHAARLALVVGALLTAANLGNLVTIPHPLWIGVLTTVTFLPMTWLGARLTARPT